MMIFKKKPPLTITVFHIINKREVGERRRTNQLTVKEFIDDTTAYEIKINRYEKIRVEVRK